ncbi:hypothetical protein EMIT0194MI4_80253 [Pseudomonas sp. IT-194MI4]|jgi:hypothetical protein
MREFHTIFCWPAQQAALNKKGNHPLKKSKLIYYFLVESDARGHLASRDVLCVAYGESVHN